MLTASEGIDVSGAQRPGSIDWARVRAEGVSWAYVKASEGTTVFDATLHPHVQGAHAAGLLVGAYHYFHPKTDDLVKSAERFAALTDPLLLELPPVIDVETLCGGPGCRAHPVAASPQDLVDAVLTWCARVQSLLGRSPVLYSGPGFLAALGRAGDALRVLPLWCADYRATPAFPPRYDVVAWQWTDGGQTGPRQLTAGVQVDRNRSPLTARDLAALGIATEPRVVARDVRPQDLFLSDPLIPPQK